MSDIDKKPKKRGRKPKNKVIDIVPQKIEIKSEEEPLIAHLSINLQEVLNNDTEDIENSILEEDSCTTQSEVDSIFLKADTMKDSSCEDENEVDKIENEILKLKAKLHKIVKNNKINVNKSKFEKGTKCWWCKNKFDTEPVQLPELYFQDKFYCVGHFCSYNCALAYNVDSNDNVWKKSSLLNLLYYKTYNEVKDITAAPDWRMLKEFGGDMTLSEFRKSSIINSNEFTMLRPPLETRCNIFEKTYKISQNVSTSSVYQKLLDDSEELVLKRSKPLKSSQYSLDKTLLIKKKKERTKKLNKVSKSKNLFL